MNMVSKNAGLDDGQAEIASIIGAIEGMTEDMRNAECCETAKDFRENLANVLLALDCIRDDIKTALSQVDL